MSSVPALFPRFSGRDLEMKLELETKLEMDLEMVGFHCKSNVFIANAHTNVIK